MTLEIPAHHIRQEICETRLPYRDGRHAKAVKVYTVNNESCYLLIQGVPSVGALNELQKLCESFGQVDQFNALDDYPCCDQYTEVYLINYKKIQSARFAKRKLDDYSFFGGVLHVCYAPEYETVNETREKLQDRRRVIAAKLKQHGYETQHKDHSKIHSNSESEKESFSGKAVHMPFYNISRQDEISNFPNGAINQPLSARSSHHRENTNLTIDTYHTEMVLETFQLPPPPKEIKNVCTPAAKVVTHNRNAKATSRVVESNECFETSRHSKSEANSLHKKLLKGNDVRNLSDGSSVIVRNFQTGKPAPKFIPRQTMKSVTQKSQSAPLKTVDSIDQDIRNNAFKLGNIQGPLDTNRKRELSQTDKSVNETILAIRSKITKVIAQEIKKQT
ncbi:RNA-binding protein 48 [Bulinus truncatus]|nr:RNA-binding protein 48 [Bulinus truncatus]